MRTCIQSMGLNVWPQHFHIDGIKASDLTQFSAPKLEVHEHHSSDFTIHLWNSAHSKKSKAKRAKKFHCKTEPKNGGCYNVGCSWTILPPGEMTESGVRKTPTPFLAANCSTTFRDVVNALARMMDEELLFCVSMILVMVPNLRILHWRAPETHMHILDFRKRRFFVVSLLSLSVHACEPACVGLYGAVGVKWETLVTGSVSEACALDFLSVCVACWSFVASLFHFSHIIFAESSFACSDQLCTAIRVTVLQYWYFSSFDTLSPFASIKIYWVSMHLLISYTEITATSS